MSPSPLPTAFSFGCLKFSNCILILCKLCIMSRDLLHVELVFRSAVSYLPSSLSPSSVSVSRSLFRIRGRLRRQSHRNFCCIFQGAHVAQVITFYRLYKKFLLPLADAVRSKVCAVLRCQVTTKDTYIYIYEYIYVVYIPTSVYIGRYHAK